MRLHFACRSCEATITTGDLTLPISIQCPECGKTTIFASQAGPDGTLDRCPACAGPHLFVQKEFPRRLGLAIVVLGAILFLVLMGMEKIVLGFGVLFGVALLDVVIYRAARLMTVCYHCQAEFRRAPTNPKHEGFDPKIAFYTAKQVADARTPVSPASQATAVRNEEAD